jgi:hypothetical protein
VRACPTPGPLRRFAAPLRAAGRPGRPCAVARRRPGWPGLGPAADRLLPLSGPRRPGPGVAAAGRPVELDLSSRRPRRSRFKLNHQRRHGYHLDRDHPGRTDRPGRDSLRHRDDSDDSDSDGHGPTGGDSRGLELRQACHGSHPAGGGAVRLWSRLRAFF